MKKSSSTGEGALVAPRRFNGWGILAASVALGALIFLVIGPMIERNAHLEALDDLEDQQRLKRGLLMLCNTEANIVHLNAQLEQKSLEERNQVTRVARTLDCIERLNPSLQAEYYLWNGSRGDVARVTAQGKQAIEPAIQALESKEEATRARAARALSALSRELNSDHKMRIDRRLSDDDFSAPIYALRISLGFPIPTKAATSPPAEPEPPAVPDMSSMMPDMPLDMESVDMLNADMELMSDASPDLSTLEDMSEDSMATDAPVRAFKLREPTLELKSPRVLYSRPPSP